MSAGVAVAVGVGVGPANTHITHTPRRTEMRNGSKTLAPKLQLGKCVNMLVVAIKKGFANWTKHAVACSLLPPAPRSTHALRPRAEAKRHVASLRQFVSVKDAGLRAAAERGDAQKFNYFHLCELFVCQTRQTGGNQAGCPARTPGRLKRQLKAFNLNVMKLYTATVQGVGVCGRYARLLLVLLLPLLTLCTPLHLLLLLLPYAVASVRGQHILSPSFNGRN